MRRTHGAFVSSVLLVGLLAMPLAAQDAQQDQSEAAVTVETENPEGDAALTPEDIDKLVAPVALFPDSLLTQIMMASTYPLDLVKADRFLKDNPDMPDKDRAAATEKMTEWDPSVQALTAGFPDIVNRMADNIDWTEQMGEAVLAQTDDVFDGVQRRRAEAKENGYLDSNDAQTVEVSNDNTIVIQPADPQIVYVPQYDSDVVYTTPAPATPVYIDDDHDNDFGNALATGAIVFGTALILDEIFDDDDPWNGYWRGPPPIDWDDADFNPRPRGINIDGDVNIDNDRFTNIERNRIKNIDRNSIDRNKIAANPGRIGDLDREQLDRKFNQGFNANDAQRAAAKQKIQNRKAQGGDVPSLRDGGKLGGAGAAAGAGAGAAAISKANRPNVDRPKVNKPANINRPQNIKKPANISKPAKVNRPNVSRNVPKASAMQRSGGARAGAASNRGHASRGGGRRR